MCMVGIQVSSAGFVDHVPLTNQLCACRTRLIRAQFERTHWIVPCRWRTLETETLAPMFTLVTDDANARNKNMLETDGHTS